MHFLRIKFVASICILARCAVFRHQSALYFEEATLSSFSVAFSFFEFRCIDFLLCTLPNCSSHTWSQRFFLDHYSLPWHTVSVICPESFFYLSEHTISRICFECLFPFPTTRSQRFILRHFFSSGATNLKCSLCFRFTMFQPGRRALLFYSLSSPFVGRQPIFWRHAMRISSLSSAW